MTPIETGRVCVCYVAIGVIIDICVSQQHVKFDPSYGGAKPKSAPSQFSWCLLVQLRKLSFNKLRYFFVTFNAFPLEGRYETAVAGCAAGGFPAAGLPLLDKVGFTDQRAAERNERDTFGYKLFHGFQ